jgi:hypothetical protein
LGIFFFNPILSFASNKSKKIVVAVVDTTNSGILAHIRWEGADDALGDEKFRSETPTDLKVVFFSKENAIQKIFYLNLIPDMGLGSGHEPKTGKPFRRNRASSFFIQGIISETETEKVEVFFKGKIIASKLIKDI